MGQHVPRPQTIAALRIEARFYGGVGLWDTKYTLYREIYIYEKCTCKNAVGFLQFYVPQSHGDPQTIASLRIYPWDMLSHTVPQSHGE